jgi:two-component system NarL family sensor kinase
MTQVRDLEILSAVAEALNSAPDAEQALTQSLALVAELLGMQTGWIWLVDPETDQFYHAAGQNLPPYLQEPVQMVGDTCSCISEFRDGALTPKNVDVIECSRLRRALKQNAVAETAGLRYHASIPLCFREKPLGIMNVAGPAWRELAEHELRLLSTIAYQVGAAIERARLAQTSTRLARSEERARLAREIHDTLAQDLTAIGLHVDGALRLLDSDPERARERLRQALATTRGSLEEARRSVLDLRATPLAGRSLAEAIGALGRAFTSDTGIRVQVRSSGAPALPLRVESELFRITQEALANVRRHARAKAVEITLRVTPRRVELTVRDDGRGIAATGHDTASGQGITGMRERAKLLGGSLRIDGGPGRGTTIVATVPLEAPTAAPVLPT